jgi:hypothetical protein
MSAKHSGGVGLACDDNRTDKLAPVKIWADFMRLAGAQGVALGTSGLEERCTLGGVAWLVWHGESWSEEKLVALII